MVSPFWLIRFSSFFFVTSDFWLELSNLFFIYIVENTSELYKELLENEKKNFQLVRSAVRDLGGIPAMINHSDMSNTIPDEKVSVLQLVRVSADDS